MKIRNAQTHSARLIPQVINSCGEIPLAHTLTHTMHLFVYNLLLSFSLQTVVNPMNVMLRIVKNRRRRLGRTIWISLTGSTRSPPVCVYWTNLWIVRVTMRRAMIATIDREEERDGENDITIVPFYFVRSCCLLWKYEITTHIGTEWVGFRISHVRAYACDELIEVYTAHTRSDIIQFDVFRRFVRLTWAGLFNAEANALNGVTELISVAVTAGVYTRRHAHHSIRDNILQTNSRNNNE